MVPCQRCKADAGGTSVLRKIIHAQVESISLANRYRTSTRSVDFASLNRLPINPKSDFGTHDINTAHLRGLLDLVPHAVKSFIIRVILCGKYSKR